MTTPSACRVWWTAARTFALPASLTPVVLGTLLAAVWGAAPFHPLRFAAALAAVVLIHAGANLFNDAADFCSGLDTVPHPGSGAVVRGWLTPAAAQRAALGCFAIGGLIGLGLAVAAGPLLLAIGAAGLLLAVLYSAGPCSLKRAGLGDVTVGGVFALLGALGAWVVQTGRFSWLPVVWAIPVGLHVIAILHANNWRDLEGDARLGVGTVARRLGDRGSLAYYGALIFLPFLLLPLGMVAPVPNGAARATLPAWTGLAWLALPLAARCWRVARNRHTPAGHATFCGLDAMSGQLNLAFGLLYALGVLLHALAR